MTDDQNLLNCLKKLRTDLRKTLLSDYSGQYNYRISSLEKRLLRIEQLIEYTKKEGTF